ncbi:unnamed protein product [Cladocopium goreaui]|uniref:Peridinin-chlorophyll a-binding protein, chloroplastic (PCP) n=1 Tax=Cladocopium goreaui TaxID=2562237 RepID=A0A9P1CPW1_9DINO|nr:unnamed protein product [Cladocopium goreaui]
MFEQTIMKLRQHRALRRLRYGLSLHADTTLGKQKDGPGSHLVTRRILQGWAEGPDVELKKDESTHGEDEDRDTVQEQIQDIQAGNTNMDALRGKGLGVRKIKKQGVCGRCCGALYSRLCAPLCAPFCGRMKRWTGADEPISEKEDLRRILPRLFNHAGVSLQDIDSVCEEVENLMGDNAGITIDEFVESLMFMKSRAHPLDIVGIMRGMRLVYERMVNMHGMFEAVNAQLDECRDFLSPLLQLNFLVAMVRGAKKAIAVGVAVAVACGLQKHLNFVPGPRHAAPVAAAAASMMMAPAAFADEIGDAAKKLGDASYSFAKEVDWNNGIFLQAPGKFQPLEALKAIDKMIEMGAAADPKLLKEAAEAHHKAIGSISGPNGVTSRADWDAVNAALGRVVASVPKAKVMAVYDSVKAITDPGVPAYMKSLVNGPDAEKAYQGFLEFKDVVEKNQVTTASAPAVVPSGDKIGVAAKALSDASYPFIKDIDWLSDIYLKPLPGKTAPETLKAIDKMIVMGAKMDGNLLKAAAEAHHKAIGSIDATGVTSAADYEAVNAAIGRLVASVPKTTVMDVYNSMAGVVDSTVTNNMFSKVNPLDAVAAAKGFYTFKDVVEASQR